MAFNIVDTSYSGTYAPYFIRQATYSMDTIEKGVVYVQGDIAKQHTIGRLDIKKPFKPREADPVDDGSNPFTADGRLIVPQDLETYKEFNPRDLELNQLAEKLSTTILARQVPQEFQSYMVMALMNRCGEELENGLWMGCKDYKGKVDKNDDRYQIQYFDGFMVKFLSDPLINLSSVSPTTISSSNVLTIMNDLLLQATLKKKALITDKNRYEKMRFLMSPATEHYYNYAVTFGTTFKGGGLSSGDTAPLLKYPVIGLAGMPDNTIIFCRANDEYPQETALWAGMNSAKDWELRIERKTAASEIFFMLGKWKYDVQYGWSDEIFMFTNLTAADFVVE